MKIKSRRYKGGGGGSTQTTPTIPDWAVPYIKGVGDAANAQYGAGNLDNVAGSNPMLDKAFNGGARAIGDTADSNLGVLRSSQQRLNDLAQSGGYDTTALKEAAMVQADQATAQRRNEFAARGTLGSARQAVQQGAQDAATRAVFAKIDQDAAQTNFQNKMAAEQGLSGNAQTSQGIAGGATKDLVGAGTTARNIEQESGDANWQALQRYASTIYGNPARQQTTAVSGGGGK
jgi:hypothetical protein